MVGLLEAARLASRLGFGAGTGAPIDSPVALLYVSWPTE